MLQMHRCNMPKKQNNRIHDMTNEREHTTKTGSHRIIRKQNAKQPQRMENQNRRSHSMKEPRIQQNDGNQSMGQKK